jgi:lysophospholipase L1-like esterase
METQESIFALPFVLMADPQLQYTVKNRTEQLMNPTEPTVPVETQVPTETLPPETVPPVTVVTIPPTTEPVETGPVYVPVDESWFDDALFIGESRTAGLQSMGRLGNADYFCATSLTVFGVLDIRCDDLHFGKQTLGSLLSSKTYGKIYIHLGINELGGNNDDIIAQYQRLIDLIREKQPDAYIILQAVMAVSRSYASNPRFAVENVNALNARIEALAVDDHFRFIDVNEWLGDEEGYLRSEMTFDGCHLYGSGYEEWAQWLLENAGWLGIP